MSTIIEKINIIDTEKQNIKTAIEGKGATVTDSLASFAPAIDSIQTGGKIEPKKTLDVVTSGNYKINAGVGFDGIAGATINVNVPSSPVDPSDAAEFAKIGWRENDIKYVPLNPGETYDQYKTRLYNGIEAGVAEYNAWNPARTSANSYFSGSHSGLTNMIYAPKIDTQNVTDMGGMFTNCTKLEIIPDYNTQNVTNMTNMFKVCKSLISVPELDIAKVTSMSSMFAHCLSLTEVRFKGGHKGIDCHNMFNKVTTTGKAYFKNDGGDYSDIIAALHSTWSYEYYD